MVFGIFEKIFGTKNDKIIKHFAKTVKIINSLESKYMSMDDNLLRNQTEKFRDRLKNESLDDILPEAFAVVREAAKRVLGQRHYDVQLMGGIALHKGMIPEMRTGEGKTLVSTLPAYLNALSSKGVHIVTTNDYLAKRDSEWMGKIHEFLGLTVGCILSGMNDDARKTAYSCDITYGTNNEFGFDYLRDNMKFDASTFVQRKLNYAIVDEVDSILVDEARTPLIISGATEDRSDLYVKINRLIPAISDEHYEKDEKSRNVHLNEEGINFVEEWLESNGMMEGSLYDINNVNTLHHVNQALKAHKLFQKDVDYIVKNNQVMIIDEFTGRTMDGRRYSEGLHQALEAKENVPIKNENQTLASITYQNYFRLYNKLSGMTGTAMTEAGEFREIYRLHVVEIPTNIPVKRVDEEDTVFRTEVEKYKAIIKLIKERNEAGQPILVGTTSIEKSELISTMLKKENVPHQILNAKYHEQEAEIISQAGRKGAVMIATNMAGRGTDIMLGGNIQVRIQNAIKNISDQNEASKIKNQILSEHDQEKREVLELGGLLVIGTERHESRRIDNQLRGRSGRQGDPGRTIFFLSLQDDLMRIFGSDKLADTMKRLGMKDDEAISHPWVSKALQKAQYKVEARNYDIRKNLLRFDDVMNEQRMVIYEQRRNIINSESVSDIVRSMIEENVEEMVRNATYNKPTSDMWAWDELAQNLHNMFANEFDYSEIKSKHGLVPNDLIEYCLNFANEAYEAKHTEHKPEVMNFAEKRFMLLSLDYLWKDHLLTLDQLRFGIGLRAYGQKDPLNEYKREAFELFKSMLDHLRVMVVERILHMEISYEKPEDAAKEAKKNFDTSISRNSICPCGSGKKYKHCCGNLVPA
ncbi:MAG: preprotein translocase subunit SecA [Alphaproteobacteria bacterium]|nr:preprotein translocase subunit SecA [Alphaproteobacteria bacterium]OJV13675.1 MAG: preprotein translocase subunit SecA [Alphaproteobacteria bacterium 33-17]